jgi:hypothetical protein
VAAAMSDLSLKDDGAAISATVMRAGEEDGKIWRRRSMTSSSTALRIP